MGGVERAEGENEGGSEMSEQTYNLLGLVLLILVLATCFCVAAQRDDLKKQAVQRGCAEWVVKNDGSTSWRWKEEAK
jgi:hypothetical protein